MSINEIQYNSIAKKYSMMKSEADYYRFLEVPSVLSLIGNCENMRCLDLGCGFGYFSKKLIMHGADQVVGVDISEKMIEIARSYAGNERRLQFLKLDVVKLKKIGDFDLVIAINLLHYISSLEMLHITIQNIYKNLKSLAKLIVCTTNPNLCVIPEYYNKYGVKIYNYGTPKDGDTYQVSFGTLNKKIRCFYWSKELLESLLLKSNFKDISWSYPLVTDEGINKYGIEYWGNYMAAPFNVFIKCVAN